MATTTIAATGGWASWTVPPGVTQVNIQAVGAGSGARRGGRAAGTLKCDPGTVLWFAVGKAGQAASGRNGGGVTFGGGGAGGDGHGSGDGGNGGGGATRITLDSNQGSTLLVAGGAGGDSGDSGHGGSGGAEDGQDGSKGNAGTGTVFDARGGTQNNPGNGGSSGGGKSYAGSDAEGGHNGRGGRGGSVNKANSHGGGGGGGGWTAGGGGQASAVQDNPGGSPTTRFPAGGGGGGANYVNARLIGATSARGTGATGDGSVTLTWSNTPWTNTPPLPPSNVTLNGVAATADMATGANSLVQVQADIDDIDIGQTVSLLLQLYRKDAQGNTVPDTWVVTSPIEQALNSSGQHSDAVRRMIALDGLTPNTLYSARLYTVDETGATSARLDPTTGQYIPTYTSISFWTNRPPNPPQLLTPFENSQINTGLDITFSWDYSDPDGGNTQGNAWLQYRTARTPTAPAGSWVTRKGLGSSQTITIPASEFRGGTLYEWRARSMDTALTWGEYSRVRSFFIVAPATPPVLTSPIGDQAVEIGTGTAATWTFIDSNSAVTQVRADLRYRVAGTDNWIVIYGDTVVPGADRFWSLDKVDLRVYQRYEWQVRTYASTSEISDWSTSAYFRTIPVAGSSVPVPVITTMRTKAPLGSGHHIVQVFDRGGQVYRGTIPNIELCRWNRRRDDIGSARIVITNFEDDVLPLLESLESWQMELVIFRKNGSETDRVFEGPITYIKDAYDSFEVQALDVMGYLKRRVIRQGFMDGYQLVNGVQVGLRSVVERSGRIIKDALAYDDPNLIPYLTLIQTPSDAKESRSVPDWSDQAQGVVDAFAQDSGLDYTTVGRRIVLWDTHTPIGRLPEMGTNDFLTAPTLTQYGMQAATLYAVTDGSGIAGIATRGGPDGITTTHGALEMVASAYGATEGVSVDPSTLTADQIAQLEETFAQQASRNIAHRWPVPWEVRIPENSRLSPEATIGINQLVPGVWIPVRAKSRVRAIAQWQKLDQVEVTETPDGESVTVIMNPAPNGGQDLDAESAAEDD